MTAFLWAQAFFDVSVVFYVAGHWARHKRQYGPANKVIDRPERRV